MKIGIVLYPTFGGSGVVATELGKALAKKGHEIHFITYSQPVRLGSFRENIFYHEVVISDYPLFDYPRCLIIPLVCLSPLSAYPPCLIIPLV